jgi:hypothetical protein
MPNGNDIEKMKNNSLILVSLLTSIALAGCGGGGGGSGSNAGAAAPASSASSPAAAASPASSTATSLPAAAPAPASTATVVGEALPSLTSPQAGSTAATGSGPIGVWTSTSGIYHTIAFVDPENNVSALTAASSFVDDTFFGTLTTTASSWSLTSGLDFTDLSFVYPTTSGSGSYATGKTFSGSYVANHNTTNLSWNFDAANALSVTQQSVTGTWSQGAASIVIAADGSFTGTFSSCNVSGTVLLATPGSNQNVYTMTVSAAAGTSCAMPAGMSYSGSAAIVFLPVTGSNGYLRTIVYSVKASDNSHIAYGQIEKQ